jgi:RNA polymerase sigma-70 factor (ECF subfamily)
MTDEELIRACAEANDSATWAEFVSRFHRHISLSIVRVGYQWGEAPQRVVDDLVQDTYLKLCANRCRLLLGFASQNPEAIVGYVKTIAMNVARDHFKSRRSLKRGSGETSQSLDESQTSASPSNLGGQEAMEREILLNQIHECLETGSQGRDHDRDCTIFWLYYRQGMSAKDIAALPTIGLSAKGVESTIFRLTRLVRERLAGVRLQTGFNSKREEKGFLPAESY